MSKKRVTVSNESIESKTMVISSTTQTAGVAHKPINIALNAKSATINKSRLNRTAHLPLTSIQSQIQPHLLQIHTPRARIANPALKVSDSDLSAAAYPHAGDISMSILAAGIFGGVW